MFLYLSMCWNDRRFIYLFCTSWESMYECVSEDKHGWEGNNEVVELS